MNPIDILGAILGNRSSRSKPAKEVVTRKRRSPSPQRREPPRRQAEYEPDTSYQLPSDGAGELEDLMADAFDSFSRKTRGEYDDSIKPLGERPASRESYRTRERGESASRSSDRPAPRSFGAEPRSFEEPRSFDNSDHRQQQALILIRAMVMAAKADGRIDQDEQDQIVGEMGGGRLSNEEVEFLRSEFARPVDIRALARAVPRGMEHHVYGASVMAIDLDSNPEAKHLHELAKAFGIPAETCNAIHEQLGAPRLY